MLYVYSHTEYTYINKITIIYAISYKYMNNNNDCNGQIDMDTVYNRILYI